MIDNENVDMSDNIVRMTDGENPAYIISMEDFDLSLLSLWRDRSSETVPLWSARASEYSQFQVFAEEIPDTDDAESENASVEPCHVCDVVVPRAHRAAHALCPLHRAAAALAAASTARASKQVSLTPTPAPPPSAHTYLCDHCSCAVDVSKRSTHEQTEQHSQAVLYTKLLTSLTKLYANKNNLNEVCKEIIGFVANNVNDTEPNTIDANYEKLDSNASMGDVAETVKEKSQLTNQLTDNQSKTVKSDIKIYTKSGAKLIVPFDNYHGFHTVGKQTQCRVCRTMVDSKDEHYLEPEHKKIVQAVLKDKHCIRQLNQILNHCILCNEIIENMEAHVLCSEQHDLLLKNSLIVDDKTQNTDDSHTKEILAENYIQKVALNDHSYFCKVCQVYIIKSTLLDHINVEAHKNHMHSVEVSSKKVRNLKKDVNLLSDPNYCEICEIYFIKGKKAEKQHFLSGEHRTKEWLLKKDTKVHYHMKKLWYSPEVLCQICDIQLSEQIDVINYHVNSENHQKKYSKLLEINYMKKVSDIHVLCSICEVTKFTIDDIVHITSRKHCKNYEKIVLSPIQVKQIEPFSNQIFENPELRKMLEANRVQNHNEFFYYCTHCKRCIFKTKILDHISSTRHKRCLPKKSKVVAAAPFKTENVLNHPDMQETVDKEDVIESAEFTKTSAFSNNEVYNADIKLLSNNYERVLKKSDDIAEPANLNAMNDIQTVKYNPTDGSTYEPPKFKLLQQKKKLHYLFEFADLDDDDEVTCLVCKINLPFDAVIAHRKHTTHKKRYTNLMKFNTMFRIKHRCFCECCREIVKINNEYMHLTSESHCSNLKQNIVRLDKSVLRELSLKMFDQDIAAEKAAKALERYSRVSRTHFEDGDSEDEGDYRFENLKTFLFLNSSNDLTKDGDEEDNSVSDSDDSFVSAKTNFEVEEILNLIPETNTEEYHTKNITSTIDFTRSVAHLFEDTNKPLEILCKLCHCMLGNRSDIIQLHTDGLKHTANYESVLLLNNLKEIVDNETETVQKYYCKACGIYVEKSEVFVHVNSYKHKLYLTSQPSTSSCSQKSENIQYSVFAEQNNSSQEINFTCNRTKDIDDNFLLSQKRYLMKQISNNELYCKICDTEVLNADLHKHVNTHVHQSNFESLLIENEVDKVGVKMFCRLCKISLTDGTELEHVYGDKHKDNITNHSMPTCKVHSTVKVNKGHVCSTCNIELVNNPKIIKFHNESVRHKSNLLRTSKGNLIESRSSSMNSISSTKRKISASNINASYFCQICKVNVPNNPKNIEMHNNGGPHKKHLELAEMSKSAISLPLVTNVTKPVPVTITTTANISNLLVPIGLNCVERGFCKVCKINVPNNILNVSEHLKGKVHNNNLQTLKSKSTENLPLQNVQQDKEVICSKTATDKLPNISPTVSNNFANNKQIKPIQQHSNIRLRELLDTNRIESYNKLFYQCKKCYQCINKADVLELISSKKHKCFETNAQSGNVETIIVDKVDDTKLKTLSIVFNYVENGYCRACKANVPQNFENIKEHVKGKTHCHNVKMLESKSMKNEPATAQKVQQVKIKNNTDHHAIPKTNKSVTNSHSSANTNLSNIAIPGSYNNIQDGYCKVCKVHISKNIENIKDHIKGRIHNQNVQNLKTVAKPLLNKEIKLKPTIISVNTKANVMEWSHLVMPGETFNCVKNGKCRVCNVKVTQNIEHIKQHVKGRIHNQNLQVLTTKNETSLQKAQAIQSIGSQNVAEKTKTNSKPAISNPNITGLSADFCSPGSNNVAYIKEGFCHLCKMKVPIKDSCIKQHVKGKNHILNLQTSESSRNQPQGIQEEVISKDNLQNPIELAEKIQTDTSNDIVYECNVCDLSFPNNPHNFNAHLTGVRHKMKLEKVKTESYEIILPEVKNHYKLASTNNANIIEEYLEKSSYEKNMEDCKPVEKKSLQDFDEHSKITFVEANSTDNSDKIDVLIKKETDNSNSNTAGTFEKAEYVSINISDVRKSDGTHKDTLKETDSSHISSGDDDTGCSGSSETVYTKCGVELDKDISNFGNTEDLKIVFCETSETTDDNINNNEETTFSDNIKTGGANTNFCDCSKNDNVKNNDKKIGSSNDKKTGYINIISDSKTAGLKQDTGNANNSKTDNATDDVSNEITTPDIKFALETDSNTFNSNKKFSKNTNGETFISVNNNNDEANKEESDVCKKDDIRSDTDIQEDDDVINGFICKDCERYVPDDKIEIKTHLTSYRHVSKVEERKLKEKEGILPSTKAHYCVMCKYEIPKNSMLIKIHNNIADHKKRFDNLLAQNRINMRDDMICYCVACDLYFSKFSAVAHINRATHATKLLDQLL